MNKKKLFSLVELIVAISIISIFSVIVILTLTKWISKSRDSSRINDIQVISKSLKMYFSQNPTYPLPDNYTIIASGNYIFTYQGKVATGVTNTLKEYLKEVLKDPSTKQFYNYVVDYYRQNFQLMTFLENDISKASISSKVYAQNNKYVYTEGDEIGFLFTGESVLTLQAFPKDQCKIELFKNKQFFFVVNRKNIRKISGQEIYNYFVNKDIGGNPSTCEGTCIYNLFYLKENEEYRNYGISYYHTLLAEHSKNKIYTLVNYNDSSYYYLGNNLLGIISFEGTILNLYNIFYSGYKWKEVIRDIYVIDDNVYILGELIDSSGNYTGYYIVNVSNGNIKWAKKISPHTYYGLRFVGKDEGDNIYFFLGYPTHNYLIKFDKNGNFTIIGKDIGISNFWYDKFNISVKDKYIYFLGRSYDSNLNKYLKLIKASLDLEKIYYIKNIYIDTITTKLILENDNTLYIITKKDKTSLYLLKIKNGNIIWGKKVSLIFPPGSSIYGNSLELGGVKLVQNRCEEVVLYGNYFYDSLVYDSFVVNLSKNGEVKRAKTGSGALHKMGIVDEFNYYMIGYITDIDVLRRAAKYYVVVGLDGPSHYINDRINVENLNINNIVEDIENNISISKNYNSNIVFEDITYLFKIEDMLDNLYIVEK